MKASIHPKYNKTVTATCVCGGTFETGSTKDEIKVEICSNCHPFYTGKQKLVDTAGRVDKFKARMEAAKKMQDAKSVKSETPKAESKTKKEEPEEKK